MTSLDHQRYLGWAHLSYAGLQLVLLVIGMVFLGLMFSGSFGPSNNLPPFFQIFFILIYLLNAVLTIPSFVSGYAFLKQRPWARVAGIVAGVVAALNFPIGTALGAYTLWFVVSQTSGQAQVMPPPPPTDWKRIEPVSS